MSRRAMAPSGTTFSTPVNAVPPGVTVVGATDGGVVDVEGCTVVGETVAEVVVAVVLEVVEVVVIGGVVVCVVEVVVIGGVVVCVVEVVVIGGVVVCVVEVVVVGGVVVLVVVVSVVVVLVVVVGGVVVSVVVVLVVVVGGVVVSVVVVLVVVVGGVVVVLVVVVGGVVVVLVVVVDVPPSQWEIVRIGVGASPSPFQFHVADASVVWTDVPGPETNALKMLPFALMVTSLPFTCRTTFVTSPGSRFPKPARIQSVVPPSHGRLSPPLPTQGVCSALANAAVGKIAQAIISKVAAETAIRPAVVSRRLLCVFLRCAGIRSYLSSRFPDQ
jgi:hypothetical protein